MRRYGEKSWTSSDGNHKVTVWKEGREVKGTVFERKTGKTRSLSDAVSIDRDHPYFPSEVSENLNRLIEEVTKS
ncbi:hypothetical protein [Aneurinibacillus migulanus]|uniref:Uncharacterized protein n=1 Tax=Aneurinibacillus migulanus TaxID=47500 RepID=A0A0D1YNR0_ANEMI|nr:hypothetical protein [Aneurinibacillus migulanus]KIV60277.1 hypothetical protein TS65_00380 [Aneurinibacillus migulanus]KON90524.1 hypothetical protein AF333_29025 [Aneurinibacillus migulanus]MED0894892.1 hypothetical protein [Aneurinibacillus migulanus]MED1614464.1 hypothetical protein [Aneurinibacillus migulanus]SDJ76997.1 hypothetical protein SAMN04487909_12824 [Aneurinibacillus migulanus]